MSSSIASSPAGIGVCPCGGGVLVDIGVPVLRVPNNLETCRPSEAPVS